MSEAKRTRPPTIDEMRAEIAAEKALRRKTDARSIVCRRSVPVVHHCHWPGCEKAVPPKMWGCREHWYRLPKHLRDRIWAAYVPGQEIRKDPSDEYIQVAKEVRDWCLEYMAQNGGIQTEGSRS